MPTNRAASILDHSGCFRMKTAVAPAKAATIRAFTSERP